MKEIKELVRISNEIGKNKELVQAGGGNTSVKTEDGRMFIKASGFTFSEMTESSGVAMLDYRKILEFLETPVITDESEKSYRDVLIGSIIGSNSLRPSIESGMHSLLSRVVVHTHPVMVNLLTCMIDGEKIAKELFSDTKPEILWIDYKYPGYNLAMELKKKFVEYRNKNHVTPEIIFLKNHGLTVSNESSEKCVKMTFDINQTIYKYLKTNFDIEDFPEIKLENKDGLHFSDNGRLTEFLSQNKDAMSGFLIPDDVVYCSREFCMQDASDLKVEKNKINIVSGKGFVYPWSQRESKMTNEMLMAKLYIIKTIKKIGTVDFLNAEHVDYIRNMEGEKYRQKLNEVIN